jgi:hypothetical protein
MKFAKLVEVIAAFSAKWAADEAKAWAIWEIRRFFDRTILIAPESLLVKYDSDWLGHIDSRPGTMVVSGKLLIAALHIRTLLLWAKGIENWEQFKLYALFYVGLLTCWVTLKANTLMRGNRRSLVSDSDSSKLVAYLFLLFIAVVVLSKSASQGKTEVASA